MAGIEEKVREIVLPFVESSGLELWGIRYRGGRDQAVLQIYVEGPEGVSIDQCGELSNLISPALDVADPIGPKYTLEISSPGLDRILFTKEQVSRYVGNIVKLELKMPTDGKRKLQGCLKSCQDGILNVQTDDDQIFEIAFTNVLLARLVPVFPAGGKKTSKSTK